MNPQNIFPEKFKPVHIAANGYPDEMAEPGAVGAGQVGDVAELFIIGEIGGWWGVYGADVYSALAGRELSLINVYISSAGGGVLQAFQIYDLLKGHPAPVHVHIFSLAASSATIIACAGDKVIISKQAMYMIHEGASYLRGYFQVKELQHEADRLTKFNNRIVDLYQRQTGMGEDNVREAMAIESWLEPEEALSLGFVHEVRDHIEVPFDKAQMAWTFWNDVFFEHTANYMREAMANQGFTKLAANVLTRLKGIEPKANNSHNQNNLNMNQVGKLFASLFAQMGWKVTDKEGNAIEGDALTNSIDQEATKEDSPFATVLGDQAKKEVSDLVTTIIANQQKEVHDAMKAISDKLAEVTNFVAEIKEKPAVEEVKKEVEQQQGLFAQLANEIKSLKVQKSGGKVLNESTNQGLDKSTDAENIKAFGEGSALHGSLVGTGLVNLSDIKEIEASVAKKMAEKK